MSSGFIQDVDSSSDGTKVGEDALLLAGQGGLEGLLNGALAVDRGFVGTT